MQKIKGTRGRVRAYANKKARKKHVESMFLTNKQKNYPYYFKDKNLFFKEQTQKRKFSPPRYYLSLKILESGYIGIKPLKAIMRFYKWFLKTQFITEGLRLRLNVFPDFVLTSKPKEMRMGKGKGAPVTDKVAAIKAGTVLFTLENYQVSDFLVRSLMRGLAWKVPFRHSIVENFW